MKVPSSMIPVTARHVKALYAQINNQEQADAVEEQVYEAVAEYAKINEILYHDTFKYLFGNKDTDDILLRVLDVLRLAYGGEFEGLHASQFGCPI